MLCKIEALYDKMFTDYPDVLSVEQLQNMLSVSRNCAYELINLGEVKSIKIGKYYRIPKLSVIEFVLDKRIVGQVPSESWTSEKECGSVVSADSGLAKKE